MDAHTGDLDDPALFGVNPLPVNETLCADEGRILQPKLSRSVS